MASTSIKSVENMANVRVHSDVKSAESADEVRGSYQLWTYKLTVLLQRVSQDHIRPDSGLNSGEAEPRQYVILDSGHPIRPYPDVYPAVLLPYCVDSTSTAANIPYARSLLLSAHGALVSTQVCFATLITLAKPLNMHTRIHRSNHYYASVYRQI